MKLTMRQQQILEFYDEGMNNPEIAKRLWLSVNTIRTHAKYLFKALGVHSQDEAVEAGRRLLLLKEPRRE